MCTNSFVAVRLADEFAGDSVIMEKQMEKQMEKMMEHEMGDYPSNGESNGKTCNICGISVHIEVHGHCNVES